MKRRSLRRLRKGDSMSKETTGGISIGFPGLLAIVFITLKLTHYITWSWLWVLSPLWLPLTAVLTIVGIVGIVAGILSLVDLWC